MKNLDKFFNPKSIAIVGASPKKGKLGNILIENIRKGGWRGKLYFVNPKYSRPQKAGKNQNKYYANLNELKKPVDLALIAIPAPLVNQVLVEGAKAKSKIENYVVISAGFKEIGKKGKKLEEELKTIAEEHQLNILGPNCLGFINTSANLNATFTDARVKEGKIAIVSQSGALEVALLDWAEEHKAGFSKAISIGNKAVLGENEIIKYLNKDKDTDAIALYLEDVKDGANFISAISEAKCRKPIAVVKAGKSRAGQKAIASHTGSLAQDESVIKAVFQKLGIISAESVEQFQDVISYLEHNKIPKSNEIAIITNAGGLGVLSADFVGSSKNLKLLRLPERIKKDLKKFLPAGASVENPIDILGDAPPERYRRTIEILMRDFKNYPLLVLLTPQNQTNPLKVAKILGALRKKFSSLSVSFVGGAKIRKAVLELEKKGIPNFESPERALEVIEAAVGQVACVRKSLFNALTRKAIRLKLKTNLILDKAKSEKRKMLFWKEAENIFKDYNIALIESVPVRAAKDIKSKKIKFPCVLKADDPKIAHRWDKKAVVLDIKNRKELSIAFKKMKRKTGVQSFLVQSMADPGLELIIGLKRERSFGPMIIVGSGGTLTEVFRDSVILIPPFSENFAKKKLADLKIFPVLSGFRGEKKYNIGEISKIAWALQQMAAENPDIAGIDINPVMFYNDGRGYKIVDAKIYLKS
jgi:acetyltransferase